MLSHLRTAALTALALFVTLYAWAYHTPQGYTPKQRASMDALVAENVDWDAVPRLSVADLEFNKGE